MADHPMQPLIQDPEDDHRVRFKPNEIIKFLMNHARENGMSLSLLADMPLPKEDWDQFYQLLGFDLDGYGTSSLVSDGAKEAADKAQRRLTKTHLPGCETDIWGCVEGCWNHDSSFDG